MDRLDIDHTVGVAALDEQHAHLIELISRCSTLIKSNRKREEIIPMIDQLFTYAKEHFALEEKYMDQVNYSETEIHKKEHRKFINIVKEFDEQYRAGEDVNLKDIMIFLMDWVINHILRTDQKYTEPFNSAGIR